MTSREDNPDEEMKHIIRGIVSVLEEENGIKLVGAAKERVVEGFLHSTRAIFFLSLLDLNQHRLDTYHHHAPDLEGKWDRVSPVEIEHTRLVLEHLTNLHLNVRHDKIAEYLEDKFRLSKYVEHMLKYESVDRAIAEFVIAIESSFLEALKGQEGERIITKAEREEITEDQVEKKEREKGKWFG